MKILKALLFALLIGSSLASIGCYADEVIASPTEVVVYRSGFGYGYWYNNYWYAAPAGYVYAPHVRPYWGPHYYPRPYYHPAPFYRGGGYRGGWRHR